LIYPPYLAPEPENVDSRLNALSALGLRFDPTQHDPTHKLRGSIRYTSHRRIAPQIEVDLRPDPRLFSWFFYSYDDSLAVLAYPKHH